MHLEELDSPVGGQFLQILVYIFTTANGWNVAELPTTRNQCWNPIDSKSRLSQCMD